jgi:hypothetical protein
MDMAMDHRRSFIVHHRGDCRTTASGDVAMDAGEVLVDPEDPRRVSANVFDV